MNTQDELTLEDELLGCKECIDDTTIEIDDSLTTITDALDEGEPIDPNALHILRGEIGEMQDHLEILRGLVARIGEHHLKIV